MGRTVTSLSLQGARALVTGGTRGIGRAIAEHLARAGADVALNFRTDERAAEAAARELSAGTGRRVVLARGDVADPVQARAVVERAAGELGGLSILVNNAGPFRLQPLSSTTPAEFRAVLDANLGSAHACTFAALPHLRRAARAVIVNLGLSATGELVRGAPHVGPYAIAKTGVAVYTKSLAAELAPEGIAVVCVAPGLIDNGHLDELQKQWMERRVPAGRLGTAAEVAEVVGFAVSERARYLSGAVLAVAGGWDWAQDRSPFGEDAELFQRLGSEVRP